MLFKQIIGRGSRLFEGKGFFRIIDFTSATRLIDEWEVPKKPEGEEILEPEEPFVKKISGLVIDKKTKLPVKDAQITFRVGRWSKICITDQYGKFLQTELPSNEFLSLTCSTTNYKKLTKKINNSSDKTNELIIEILPEQNQISKIKINGIPVSIEEEVIIEFDGNNITFKEYIQKSK